MRSRKLWTVAAVIGAGAAIAIPVAQAVTAPDTDDSIAPASTATSAALKVKTAFKASASVSGIPVTVSCSSLTFSFTTPASGFGPMDLSTPQFTGCKDNFGGKDTVTTDPNAGSWTLTFTDAKSDESLEGNPLGASDTMTLGVPQNAGTFTSTLLSGCTGHIAPNGPATLTGKYNDKGQYTLSGAKLPISGTGCTTPATAGVSATIIVSPSFKDLS
jgi:hypothetical protein